MHVNPRRLKELCSGKAGPTEKHRLKNLSAGLHPFSGEALNNFHYLASHGWVDNLDTLAGDMQFPAEDEPEPVVIPLQPYVPYKVKAVKTTAPESLAGLTRAELLALMRAPPQVPPWEENALAEDHSAELEELNSRS